VTVASGHPLPPPLSSPSLPVVTVAAQAHTAISCGVLGDGFVGTTTSSLSVAGTHLNGLLHHSVGGAAAVNKHHIANLIAPNNASLSAGECRLN